MFSISSTGKTGQDDFDIFSSPTETNTEGEISDKNAMALRDTLRKGLDKIFPPGAEDEKKQYKEKTFGILFDTTSTNTGWRGGFNGYAEQELESGSKLHIPCRSHICDTANKYGHGLEKSFFFIRKP